jgi:hypothetical protein
MLMLVTRPHKVSLDLQMSLGKCLGFFFSYKFL